MGIGEGAVRAPSSNTQEGPTSAEPPAPWLPGLRGCNAALVALAQARGHCRKSWGHGSAPSTHRPTWSQVPLWSQHRTQQAQVSSNPALPPRAESPASFLLLQGAQNPRRCSGLYRGQSQIQSGQGAIRERESAHRRGGVLQTLGTSLSRPPTIHPPTAVGVGVELVPRAQLTGRITEVTARSPGPPGRRLPDPPAQIR